MDLQAAKQQVCEEIDRRATLLLEVSHQIHARPELGFEEQFAHELLVGVLGDEGIDVEAGAYGLPTAFAASAGSTGPTIAVLCEYDALPGIGHACGHNIIGAAGLGAGLATAAIAAEAGGRVMILGTPAEEGGGGKVLMARRGAFESVDAAMMVHPAGFDLDSMQVIAVQQVWVSYEGEGAHAAAFPHRGRNALDAAVLGYNNVAALRQHIRPEERIHGIFTEAGDKPNIVPDHTAAQWYVRADSLRRLEPLKERVLACLEAGATAAGCTMTHEWRDPAYADLRPSQPMIGFYRENSEALGRELIDHETVAGIVGSTDMGNVSHVVPSIHPMIKAAPDDCFIHTARFADHAVSEQGDAAVLDGAKAMAMTVCDLWLRPGALADVRDEFEDASGGRSRSESAS